MSVIKCYFCGRAFASKNALRAHLQYCMERKKQRDWWTRYPVAGDQFKGNVCVVSRSPKTLDLIAATHQKLLDGSITPAGFAGYVQALGDVKLVEFKIEPIEPEGVTESPGALQEVSVI